MDLHETLSALLPPPRDDEPASLRQDILDELGDHLACAYNRELMRGANSPIARQRVLARFGDPAAVARRLWFDAMKGKIMAQRLVIVTCLLVTIASLSLVGLVWIQSSRAAAQAQEANRQLSRALAQSQIASKDMMKTLSEMSDAIRNPRSPDWNPVKFKLTDDTTDGPPAVGWSIRLQRTEAPNSTIDRTTDNSGIADFGLLHPGTYTFGLSKNQNFRFPNGSGQFNVEPGSSVKKPIVFPKKALEHVPVRVRCTWPADLEKDGLVVDASFTHVPLDIDGTSWSTSSRSVLCGPGAGLAEILVPGAPYLWATSSERALRADILTSHVRTIDESAESLNWERGTYRLFDQLIVLRPIHTAAGSARRLQFEIIARGTQWQAIHSYELRGEPPTEDDLTNRGNFRNVGGGVMQMGQQGVVMSQQSWASIGSGFEARPDQVNQWTITLPDELVSAVRAKLRAKTAPKPD
jgi:type II secretory pathway pseudopilin PulG